MRQDEVNYNNGIELLNRFINSVDTDNKRYQELATRKDIVHALALLQDNSGIIRHDYTLAKLCADCFSFGYFIGQPALKKSSFDNLVAALRSMGLKASESKEAANYAISKLPDGNEDEQLTLAFQYHGAGSDA